MPVQWQRGSTHQGSVSTGRDVQQAGGRGSTWVPLLSLQLEIKPRLQASGCLHTPHTLCCSHPAESQPWHGRGHPQPGQNQPRRVPAPLPLALKSWAGRGPQLLMGAPTGSGGPGTQDRNAVPHSPPQTGCPGLPEALALGGSQEMALIQAAESPWRQHPVNSGSRPRLPTGLGRQARSWV